MYLQNLIRDVTLLQINHWVNAPLFKLKSILILCGFAVMQWTFLVGSEKTSSQKRHDVCHVVVWDYLLYDSDLN